MGGLALLPGLGSFGRILVCVGGWEGLGKVPVRVDA